MVEEDVNDDDDIVDSEADNVGGDETLVGDVVTDEVVDSEVDCEVVRKVLDVCVFKMGCGVCCVGGGGGLLVGAGGGGLGTGGDVAGGGAIGVVAGGGAALGGGGGGGGGVLGWPSSSPSSPSSSPSGSHGFRGSKHRILLLTREARDSTAGGGGGNPRSGSASATLGKRGSLIRSVRPFSILVSFDIAEPTKLGLFRFPETQITVHKFQIFPSLSIQVASPRLTCQVPARELS